MAHMRGASLKDKAAFIAAMLHYPKSQVTQKRLRREDPPMERMQAGKPGESFRNNKVGSHRPSVLQT